MEEVPEEAKAQQKKPNRGGIEIGEEGKASMLALSLGLLLVPGLLSSCVSRGLRVATSVRMSLRCMGMAAAVRGSMRVSSNVAVAATNMSVTTDMRVSTNMCMTASVCVAAKTAQQGSYQEEPEAQQEAEDENQGKRIRIDQGVPSFRGNPTQLSSATDLATHAVASVERMFSVTHFP